ncbi:hypothetical protein JCM10908_001268 [Rhodotorula pacifica]|uniref:uncharacterized protein n=1 Tax=Rhodotorula pacifica TaxID=1495444 RepID=UPI00316BA090
MPSSGQQAAPHKGDQPRKRSREGDFQAKGEVKRRKQESSDFNTSEPDDLIAGPVELDDDDDGEEEKNDEKLAVLSKHVLPTLSKLSLAQWTGLQTLWSTFEELELMRNGDRWQGSSKGLQKSWDWRSRSWDDLLLKKIVLNIGGQEFTVVIACALLAYICLTSKNIRAVLVKAQVARAKGKLADFFAEWTDLASDEPLKGNLKNLVYLLYASELMEGYLGYTKQGGKRLDQHGVAAASDRLADARERVDFAQWDKKVVYSLTFKAAFLLLFAEHICITLADATRRGFNTLAFDAAVLGNDIPLDVLKYTVLSFLDIVCPRDSKTGKRVSNGTRLNQRLVYERHESISSGNSRCKLTKISMLSIMQGSWLPWVVRKIMKDEGVLGDIFPNGRWPTPLIPTKQERDAARASLRTRKADIEESLDGWYDVACKTSQNKSGFGKVAGKKVWSASTIGQEWWKSGEDGGGDEAAEQPGGDSSSESSRRHQTSANGNAASFEDNFEALKLLPKLDDKVLAEIEEIFQNKPQQLPTYGR